MRRLVIAVGILSGSPISIGLSRPRETSWRSPLTEKQIIPLRVHLRAAKASRGVYVVFIYLFIRLFTYLFPAHLRVTPSAGRAVRRTAHQPSGFGLDLTLRVLLREARGSTPSKVIIRVHCGLEVG